MLIATSKTEGFSFLAERSWPIFGSLVINDGEEKDEDMTPTTILMEPPVSLASELI